jgi:copper homeostasis protein
MNVMIRPRGGDFCYSDVEFETMKLDVELCKRNVPDRGQVGADGVVFGILNPDGTVDAPRTAELIRLARPLSVTFHRAFDVTRDPYEALETLIGLGVDRILTSGQEPSALEGLDLIADLVKAAGDRVIIMPGGGITERNIERIVAGSGAREIHVYAPMTLEGRMKYRNPRVFMGGELRPPEYTLSVTDPNRVRALVGAIR